MFDCRGSLQMMVAVLATAPANPPELNWRGTAPVLPGCTNRSHTPALVHPQPGFTSITSSVAVPVLVNRKLCLTDSPQAILPKSNTVDPNSIRGAGFRPWEIRNQRRELNLGRRCLISAGL